MATPTPKSLKIKLSECLPFGKILLMIARVGKNIFQIAKLFPTEVGVGFFGWDMYTPHSPPWTRENKVSQTFNIQNSELLELINSKKFISTYFSSGIAGLRHGSFIKDIDYLLYSLKWRHYNIFWSVNFAINNTDSAQKNFVECGVCDGLSTYFAITSSIAEKISNHKFYLYDSWGTLKDEYLSEQEIKEKKLTWLGRENYTNSDLENTKSNLRKYEDVVVYNKGYITDELEYAENPNSLVWMHIDLNSAKPTLSVLNYFHDKMLKGGVILFDDYGWRGYEDTRKTIDKFFKTKKGTLLPLPTGQAIYFKLD